jgi:hypothetical protein
MHCRTIVVAGLALLLATGGVAFGRAQELMGGKTINQSVRAGVSTEVAHYTSWDGHTCEANGGAVVLQSKPQHGTVTPTSAPRTFFHGSRGGTRCAGGGRVYPAFVVFYKSERGFRGTDSFSIEVRLGNGRVWTENFNISVN